MGRAGFPFVLSVLLGLGCEGGDEEGTSGVACRYHQTTSFICSGYSDLDESDECVDLGSAAACDDYTESRNSCSGDCCSDTTYTNVSATTGSCATPAGSGGSTGSGGGGSVGPCGASAEDTACTACMKQYCCDERTACTASPACTALADCVAACTTDACVNACAETYAAAFDAYLAYLDCAASSCGVSC